MSGYSRYEDALIAKLRIHEWYSTHQGENYLHAFFESMNEKHDPEERLNVDGLVYLQRQMIQRAEPIYVSMDVKNLVDDARWSFKPEVLLPGDPFIPCGFAIFPEPVYLDDKPTYDTGKPTIYQEGIPVRAMSWLPMHSEDLSQGCYWISFFVHVDDDPPTAPWDDEDRTEMRRNSPLMLMHHWQWTWGRNPVDGGALVYDGETEELGKRRSIQQAMLVQTFWRLGQQWVPVKERAPRGIWRDAQRKNINQRDIHVMLLRRGRPPKESEPTGRTMKVRSITSGHWRNQPYPSLGEGVTRQIWIDPYVRGPEDAPLIFTKRAIEFKR